MSTNFNTTFVLNTNQVANIAKDAELGKKIAQAVQGTMFGGSTTVEYDGVVAITAVETHKGDQIRLIAVGNDTGRDIGSAGAIANMEPGNERALFEAGTANFDLVVRKEAVRGAKEEGEKAAGEPSSASGEPATS